MNDILLVARREIGVRARTKGFLISLAVSAVLVAALAMLPKLFAGNDSYDVGLVGSDSLRTAATTAATAQKVDLSFTPLPDEAAARTALLAGDIDAAVLDGRALLADGAVDRRLGVILQAGHTSVKTQEQLRAAGLDPAKVTEAMRVAPLTEQSVSPLRGDSSVRSGFAMLIVFVLFFLLMSSVTAVAMGVVEEKGSRIVELILTSIRPWQLLAGKILGLGVLGLVNLGVIIVAGLSAGVATGLTADLPDGVAGIVAGAVVWFLLGYAFFAVLAAGFGSLVSRQEEVGGVLTPLTTLLMAVYLVAFYAVAEPTGPLARVLSLVPPFSSMVMPVRMAATEVQLWELAVAAVAMLAAVAAVLAAGARIYRRAVLRTGARIRLTEVLR
ncbi:ABC transporter permease [Spongiactinospora gelatinilytica]|uniref:ABC transporter permease n=1 Tax=Spongiactinospora gelatinilytica TaxID=2666298 RepID=A0A2W2GCL0_9ACTN|nr:ABC transporter permease [Spongiactinospora gelatinilytica]PZG38015.1 ABC transporter permease [Spongiactinospora gelatinilytica]